MKRKALRRCTSLCARYFFVLSVPFVALASAVYVGVSYLESPRASILVAIAPDASGRGGSGAGTPSSPRLDRTKTLTEPGSGRGGDGGGSGAGSPGVIE